MSYPRTYPQHIRAILTLGLPLIGGHLAQMAIGITDTVMTGWYGVEALAAVTLGSTFFFLFFLFGSGFAWAVMPMVAAFSAEGDEVGIRRATRMGLWLSAGFGLCVLPIMWWSEPLLRMLGQGDLLAVEASSYLRIAGFGVVPALIVMVLKSYLAALERTQVVLWITVVAAIANGLCNWAFIFGNWGAPELGVQGAAIASVTTQVVSLVAVVAYVQLVLPQHTMFARLWRADGDMLAQVFRLGWPIGLTTLSEVGLFTAAALMMGWIGTVSLAAHGIAVQLASLTFMVHVGLGNVATIRAGNALGRGDADALRRGAIATIGLSLGFSAAAVAVFLIWPVSLIDLFIESAEPARPEILAIGIGLLATAALFQLVDGAQVIALSLLRGLQDTRMPMIFAAISYWAIGIPVSYVLGFRLGLDGIGVWMGLVSGLALACVLLMGRFWLVVAKRAIPLAQPA